jgi:hypothetical protein
MKQAMWDQGGQAGARQLQAAGLVRLNSAKEQVLTPAGQAKLLGILDRRRAAGADADRPRWDGEVLWWLGQPVKRLGATASVQKELVEELAKAGSPDELPVPGGKSWRATLKRWRRGAAGLTACQERLVFEVRAGGSKRVLRWKAIE